MNQTGHNPAARTARIESANPHPTLDFAKEELTRFAVIEGGVRFTASSSEAAYVGWVFHLDLDPALPAYAFGYKVQKLGDCSHVYLRGSDPACVLHSVYTFLEDAGYRFEINGPLAPDILQLDCLINKDILIRPRVQRRGIRQHINFPMDISSYPLGEACEYIRNLARLRFNHIVFHSYPNQWIAGPQAGSGELAGSFFYGLRYEVPEAPIVCCSVRNERVFCIPEIEPVYDQPEERSRMAIAWLRAVMAEAKRVGLTVQFSFEPRGTSTDPTLTLQTTRWILQHYPQIDILEWMTQEMGHYGETLPLAELKQRITAYLGQGALDDPELNQLLREDMPQFPQLIQEVGHNLCALQAFLQDSGTAGSPQTCLGVYCVESPVYLNACLNLMRRFAPSDTAFALLPDYGSYRSAKTLRKVKLEAADYTRTMLYCWLEFDGLMYLQQNGVEGIHQVLADALEKTSGNPLYGICFNHWRTAENRIPARYAALATLYGPFPEEEFYRNYAGQLGIENSAVYAEAMRELNQLEKGITDELFNIGFCYEPCWGHEGLGWLANWEPQIIREVIGCLLHIKNQIGACLESVRRAAGMEYLEFLDNRLEATVLYLRGIQRGCELQPLLLGKTPADLTPAERASVDSICAEAIDWLTRYLHKLASLLPDRGAEGLLISAYHTPLAVIRRVRSQYAVTR